MRDYEFENRHVLCRRADFERKAARTSKARRIIRPAGISHLFLDEQGFLRGSWECGGPKPQRSVFFGDLLRLRRGGEG